MEGEFAKIVAGEGFNPEEWAYTCDKTIKAYRVQSARSELLAGMLLVKEAGGLIRDLHARDIRSENLPEVLASGNIMALNPNLNTVLHDLLNK